MLIGITRQIGRCRGKWLPPGGKLSAQLTDEVEVFWPVPHPYGQKRGNFMAEFTPMKRQSLVSVQIL